MDGSRKNKALTTMLLIMSGYFLSDNAVNSYYENKLDYVSSQAEVDKDAIIKRGDVIAYNAFIDSVRNDPRVAYNQSNYIDYSIIMAHRHGYDPANYDIYYALMAVFGEEKTDSATRQLALYYLNRGATRGDSLCRKELERRAKDPKNQNSSMLPRQLAGEQEEIYE